MLTLEGLSGSFWMTSLLVLPPGERFNLVWKDSMFSWRLLSDFLDSRTQSSGSLCFVVLISGLGLCLSWQSLFLKSMNLMMTDEEKSTLSHGPALHTKLCLSCNFTFTLLSYLKDQEDWIYHSSSDNTITCSSPVPAKNLMKSLFEFLHKDILTSDGKEQLEL